MKRPAQVYTAEQKLWLKWHSALPRAELARMFNEHFGTDITAEMIKRACLRFGLKTGRTGCFEKGHVRDPGSGAQKGTHNAGTFKKGQRPANWKPVGTEITDVDGYIQVKTAEPNTWAFKHHLVWEAANGPRPRGMVVRFIDGNKQNVFPDNLILITKAEHMHLTRRQYNTTPESLKPVTLTALRLEAAIFKRLRDI
ncbi:HNH endonuclease signature motif containing protein [Acerihabitans arboris]|uniref:HNH endonuclease n=1 Tax=Acerihabitans arboris TaxID=2691583 RepID=A0A845SMP5_9GAMM|nr:HNH endonuclease signature motif containing protein [Acerihabitans arboris]NDL64236.1 HNH endonuclease [Acerihabitans arboris]